MNLVQSIYQHAIHSPKKVALSYEGTDMTYEEVERRVANFAHNLKRQGMKKKSHIAIVESNCPEFIIALYAIMRIQATAIPINPSYTHREMEYILKQSDTELIISNKHVQTDLPIVSFEQMLSPSGEQAIEQIEDDQVALILYTSGTTGEPKGAMLTHKNLYSNACDVAEFLQIFHEDCVIVALPIFHVFALTVAVNAPLKQGATLLIHRSFSPAQIFKAANEEGATVFAGVPTMYSFLLNSESDYATPLKSIRLAISGGSSLPIAVLEGFEKRFDL
ncbi:MAG: AMP-binding protein, partial [Kurthia sp.]